ncbi:MAG: ABC transporter ATP-binding protein [Rhodospirillaceae bacterium]|nr:ABC transporter ATP-binding protein [Rhodospirillaceae bacterium]
MSEPLLTIDNLVTRFPTKRGRLTAVDGVSLTLERRESLGLVGESGSGKSVLGLSVMRLVQPPGKIESGAIRFDGHSLLDLDEEGMRQLRGRRLAMIFQDPTATLNPVFTIGEQIAEVLRWHTPEMSPAEMRERVTEMLDRVGIPNAGRRLNDYPHEFSGGMQQRVIIAAALILNPHLVIADEPTTALDVTVQAQILDLLRRLKDGEPETAIILVSHDLGVVGEMCERIAVMYAGNLVEVAPADDILDDPKHPYTVGLIASIPRLDREVGALSPIPGRLADPVSPPPGCKFNPRCAHAFDRCRVERPVLKTIAPGRQVACHLHD